MLSLDAVFTLPDVKATEKFGAALGSLLRIGDVIALKGKLGIGKTTLARAAIQARLGRAVEVVSPTFTLVQTYDAKDLAIWHFDLYRLVDADEVEELGWEEALREGACLVEWPQQAEHRLPLDRLSVELLSGFNPDARSARISGACEGWRSRIDRLKRVMNEPSRHS